MTSTTTTTTPPLIVLAPTFYGSTDDIRYALGLESCRKAAEHGVRLLIVDASPNHHDTVRESFTNAGTDAKGKAWVEVIPQTYQGKKGAALQEGVAVAQQRLQNEFPSQKDTSFVAMMEPEKFDLVQFFNPMAQHMAANKLDILFPRRPDALFQNTYPIEQYHAENFANIYLNTLGQAVGFPSVDWTFGPIVFRASLASHWLEYNEGDLWDVQFVPLIRAWRRRQQQTSKKTEPIVASYAVDYHHPDKMKQEEEGVAKWSEKRLFQLNLLFDKVAGELKKQQQQQQQEPASTDKV
ncbi:expressed unknown protein [Seminavis robusta]|uniref:Uncharacterized protein n=1 Tax=Seminavis robusta TaxID=568900 RepID=A0A9N8DY14_9STRA|nr:expressed unknown protein [Seminavis robusta]|eukprot:Sro463_g148190.1 n/a (295) ;mRNA; r:25064-25948